MARHPLSGGTVRRILVATDLAATSDSALARGVILAREEPPAALVVLHVVADEARADAARAALQERVRRAVPPPAQLPRLEVRAGDPARLIAEASIEFGADLVVLGRHRRQLLADLVTGGTAERVLRSSRVPVLLAHTPAERPYQHALFAVDFSEPSQRALAAVQELGIIPAEAAAVHAFRAPGYGKLIDAGLDAASMRRHVESASASASRELARFLASAGLTRARSAGLGTLFEAVVRAGPPAQVIREAAGERRSQLLVLGTRGLTGLKRAVLGSVAEDLVRDPPCDLLVVPPRAPAAIDTLEVRA